MIFFNMFSHKLPFYQLARWGRSYCTSTQRNGNYRSVVGLEVHAQILTNTKLFSGAPNNPSAPANTCVSFFDAAMPGTLPRLNKKCVESAVRTALVLHCDLNQISMFDRKHYFYADSPAGYQITQQRLPLAVNGKISFIVSNVSQPYFKSSKIHQIQLEQDSGKSIHFPETRTSLLDLNRAGVPLMEIVFEPDLATGEEAASLLKELSLILTRLGVCSCKGGSLRCDANISIHKAGEPLGTRSEVKNISSFRAVAKAIEFEIDRQIKIKESGGVVVNETRSWNEETGTTIRMRDKEVLQDYRFMPEPNLLPLNLKSIDLTAIKQSLPEMPDLTRETLTKYNMPSQVMETLVKHENLLNLFLSVAESTSNLETVRIAANLIKTSVISSCKKLKVNVGDCQLTKDSFEEILMMYRGGVISGNVLDDLFVKVIENPSLSPRELVEANNMKTIHDPVELKKLCETAIELYPKIINRIRNGKEKDWPKLMKLLLKLSKNRADKNLTREIMEKLINELTSDVPK